MTFGANSANQSIEMFAVQRDLPIRSFENTENAKL